MSIDYLDSSLKVIRLVREHSINGEVLWIRLHHILWVVMKWIVIHVLGVELGLLVHRHHLGSLHFSSFIQNSGHIWERRDSVVLHVGVLFKLYLNDIPVLSNEVLL